MISAKLMKQTIDVDDAERPRGSANCRHTTPSGHAEALPKNLIAIPHAGFTAAKVQRSHSPISSCVSKSRVSKLGAAQHHNSRQKKERNKRMERCVFLRSYFGDASRLL
jgi:hypothetical protein